MLNIVSSPQRPPMSSQSSSTHRSVSSADSKPAGAVETVAVLSSSKESARRSSSSSSSGAETTTAPADVFRQRLVAFYEVYNPSCVPSVPAISATYAGREEELMKVLIQKYGPEPAGDVQRDASHDRTNDLPAVADTHTAVSSPQRPPLPPPASSTVAPSTTGYDGGDTLQAPTPATRAQPTVPQLRAAAGDASLGVGLLRPQDTATALGSKKVTADAEDTTIAPQPAAPVSGITIEPHKAGLSPQRQRQQNQTVTLKPNEVTPAMLRTQLEAHQHQQQQQQQQGGSAESNSVSSQRSSESPITPPTQPSPVDPELKERVVNFYRVYNPSKIDEVDIILQAFKQQPGALMHHLVRKYGPEPPLPATGEETQSKSLTAVDKAAATPSAASSTVPPQSSQNLDAMPPSVATTAAAPAVVPTVAEWKARFENFFHYYRPEKLHNLDERLANHAGHESEWMSLLVAKYGPEPPARKLPLPQQEQQQHQEPQLAKEKTRDTATGRSASGSIITAPPPPVPQPDAQPREAEHAKLARKKDPIQRMEFKSRLCRYFSVRNPALVEHVDPLVDETDEEALMSKLFEKYGPEPTAAEVRRVGGAGGATPRSASSVVEGAAPPYDYHAETPAAQTNPSSARIVAAGQFLRSPSPPQDLMKMAHDVVTKDQLSYRLQEPVASGTTPTPPASAAAADRYYEGQSGLTSSHHGLTNEELVAADQFPPHHYRRSSSAGGSVRAPATGGGTSRSASARTVDAKHSTASTHGGDGDDGQVSAIPQDMVSMEQFNKEKEQHAELIKEYESIVVKLSEALESKTNELEGAITTHNDKATRLKDVEKMFDEHATSVKKIQTELADTQETLDKEQKRALELAKKNSELEEELKKANESWEKAVMMMEEATREKEQAQKELADFKALDTANIDRLKSTVAVREHQCRMLRMQFHQQRGELETKDEQIGKAQHKNKELQGRVTALLSEIGTLQLELTPQSNPEKFYEVVQDIQSSFRSHYEQRIESAESELSDYYLHAKEQVKNRDQLIDELTQKVAEDSQEKAKKLEEKRQELAIVSENLPEGERGLATEVAQLKTQLAVQHEEHKALVQLLQSRGAAELLPPPSTRSIEPQHHRSASQQQLHFDPVGDGDQQRRSGERLPSVKDYISDPQRSASAATGGDASVSVANPTGSGAVGVLANYANATGLATKGKEIGVSKSQKPNGFVSVADGTATPFSSSSNVGGGTKSGQHTPRGGAATNGSGTDYALIRDLKQQVVEHEAEARAAKSALNTELARQVEELNVIHEKMAGHEAEKDLLRKQLQEMSSELQHVRNFHDRQQQAPQPVAAPTTGSASFPAAAVTNNDHQVPVAPVYRTGTSTSPPRSIMATDATAGTAGGNGMPDLRALLHPELYGSGSAPTTTTTNTALPKDVVHDIATGKIDSSNAFDTFLQKRPSPQGVGSSGTLPYSSVATYATDTQLGRAPSPGFPTRLGSSSPTTATDESQKLGPSSGLSKDTVWSMLYSPTSATPSGKNPVS